METGTTYVLEPTKVQNTFDVNYNDIWKNTSKNTPECKS